MADIEAALAPLTTDIGFIEAKLDAQETAIGNLTIDVSNVDGGIGALEAKADALVFDIDDILAAVGPLGLKLDNLGLATLAIEGKLDTQGFDLGVANTGITDIQAALAAHDSEGGGGLGLAVAALETKLDVQAFDLDALLVSASSTAATLSVLEGKADALEAKLDELDIGDLTDLDAKLDEVIALLQSFPQLAKGDNGKGK